MSRIRPSSTLVALTFLLAAGVAAQSPHQRPSDDLLNRPDLQALVDVQVQRDGPALVAHLTDDDPAVRGRAAFALASVQDSSAVPALLTLLDDSVAGVRADAAFALGQAPGGVPSGPLLSALLAERNDDVRRLLIEALGKQGDQVALQELFAADLPASWRGEVALAVGRFALRGLHTPEAVAYLVECLGSEKPDVRRLAAYYFGRTDNTEAWRAEADTVRARLDGLDSTDTAAMHLVLGVGRLGDPADTPRLKHWLEHGGDWRIQVNAVRALSARTDEKGVRTLLYDQLVNPSLHVAIAAAEALNDGKAWPEEDLDVIRQWVRYNAYAWRITSPLLVGMAHQDPEFVFDELTRRRGSRATFAYAAGLSALGMIDDPNAFDWLISAAHQQEPDVALAAYRTLARRWRTDRERASVHDVYYDVFADGLRRTDLALTSTIAPVLADTAFRPFGATGLLRTVYESLHPAKDREQMTALLHALGSSGDSTLVDLLQRETTHPDPDLNAAAVRAYRDLTGISLVPPARERPVQRTVTWSMLQDLGPHPRIELRTERGTLLLELDAEQAPLTTLTIAQFVEMDFYDGVPFHRVVGNFVIQGGDFARGDGFGSPAFAIRSEFTRIRYEHGTLGMASAGKDTEGSQFFITHSMQPHLDGRYSAFGRVIHGQAIVDQLHLNDRILEATLLPDPSL